MLATDKSLKLQSIVFGQLRHIPAEIPWHMIQSLSECTVISTVQILLFYSYKKRHQDSMDTVGLRGFNFNCKV
jgi:hypothetical protein